jgi:single-stranded-DNA-specific exonuclease
MSYLSKEELNNSLQSRHEKSVYKTLKDLPKPTLFKDITKATQRVVEAIQNQEKITVVGDYDVDGVVSSVIMNQFFEKIGFDIDVVIPNRFEHGYGLSPKILDDINSTLIITVDNGISAYEAADICKQKGIDLIITDHHTVGERVPNAYAIVNPKQLSNRRYLWSTSCVVLLCIN